MTALVLINLENDQIFIFSSRKEHTVIISTLSSHCEVKAHILLNVKIYIFFIFR